MQPRGDERETGTARDTWTIGGTVDTTGAPSFSARSRSKRTAMTTWTAMSSSAVPRTAQTPPTYSLPALPYAFDALEPHLSAELLEIHHDEHHAAYVKGANDTLEKLAKARRRSEFAEINQLEKSLAFHLSGHLLHSLLWKNLTP
jgi:hypothetical protein